jgi:hypothetical protein
MPIVVAMLLAPLLALGQQVTLFMLLGTACARGSGDALHALAVLFIVATALATLVAVPASLRRPDGRTGTARRIFAARVGVGVGALATLASVALWLPQWLLSPCTQ